MFVPQVGDVIADRYRLEGRIASGGMGEVWRAVDLVLDRPVAVKLLKDTCVDHPETLARFRAEARHAAALSHPQIAQIYDYGDAQGDRPPFLVMELVDGPPLSVVLADGPLEADRVLDVISQAAAGLNAAHAAGVLHRDIKPGNLLVDADGVVKITDFGISYATGSAPLTRTGMLIGTPAYLAPERVAGGGAGPASDLYSLGVVAYECLAGAQPFGGTAMEVALSHWHTPLPPLPPDVPSGLVALVANLTAKDPADRPASAIDVAVRAARLRAALSNGASASTDAPVGHTVMTGRFWAGVGAAGDWLGRGDVHTTGPSLGQWENTLNDPGIPFADSADGRARGGAGWLLGLRWDVPAGRRAPGQLAALRAAPGPLTAKRPVLERHVALIRAFRPASVRRAAVYAAVGVAMVCGLAGVLASGQPNNDLAYHGRSRQLIMATTDRTVEVNAATLVGRRVCEVIRRLHRLGQHVRLIWQANRRQAPDTVLSVSPKGRVRAGSTVLVIASTGPVRPAWHRHHGHYSGVPDNHAGRGPPGHAPGGHGRGHGGANSADVAGRGPPGHAGHGSGGQGGDTWS